MQYDRIGHPMMCHFHTGLSMEFKDMNADKICIIEGSILQQQMYHMVFEKYKDKGLTVLYEYRGDRALLLLEANCDTDIIILDLNLKDIQGLDVLNLIQSHKLLKQIPVVIIGSKGCEEDIIEGLHAGASAYLIKPFQPANLIRIIERILNKSRLIENMERIERLEGLEQ